MEAFALILGAALAAACVVFVARPLLGSGRDSVGVATPDEEQRLLLVEERDRALAALKELEFDHRTGKVSDEDYRALVGSLRLQAGEALRALEPKPSDREREKADAGR